MKHHHLTIQNVNKKPRQNRVKLPKQTTSKNDALGVPNILQATKVEPLNHPLTIKLPETLAKYIEDHGGCDFVRDAILEKLQRIIDKPSPARCSECVNLVERDGQPFCLWSCCTFLPHDQKLLNEAFSCEGFTPRRKKK